MDEVEEAPDEKEYVDPNKLKAVNAPKTSSMARQWKPIDSNHQYMTQPFTNKDI